MIRKQTRFSRRLSEEIARITEDAFPIAARVAARRVTDANRFGKSVEAFERRKRKISGQNTSHGNTVSDDGSEKFVGIRRFERVGRHFIDASRRRVVGVMIHIA